MSEAWQRKEGKDPKGGLNKKGVASYRAANPGSKLQTAVTTKPSKLKKGSKPAKRRKSFCARMEGMKSKLTSSKTANDPDSRINKSLRKWNCKDGGKIEFWDKKNPKPKSERKTMTPSQKSKAKARASAAGRPYPNLVDNAAVMEKGGAVRNYKKEYQKFQSSPSQIKKRTELNRINHEKETYGNGDGLDVSHVNGGVKLEPESTNRGRKEKSRMNGSKRKMEKGGEIETPAEKENIKAIVDKINKHNARQRKGTGGVKPYQPKNPREAAILDSIQKGKGFGKKGFKMPKPKMANGGYAQFNPGDEKGKSSGYNELEQKKKAAKVAINKAKEKIAKEKEEYQEYVDSGQRKKDRDTYKKKGKEEVKEASNELRNRKKSSNIENKKKATYEAASANEEKLRRMARTINPNDKKSVMAFQKAAGLQVDGKFGPATLRELRAIQGKKVDTKPKKVDTKPKKPKVPFTDSSLGDTGKDKKIEMESPFKKLNLRKGKSKKVKDKFDAKTGKRKSELVSERAQDRFNKKKKEESLRNQIKRLAKKKKTFNPETGEEVKNIGDIIKQRKSKTKYQDGGMLEGPSHAKGGIAAKVGNQPIEMEGGEYVIKKSSAKKLGEDVLNYLNETGKVPQFMAGGYAKKMYMDGGMVEQEALEMGGKVQDNRAGFTPVYEHGGCVSMSDMNAGAGDVAHTHTHSGYKAGE